MKLDYRTRDGAHMSKIRDPPALLGTCKLIRNEASAIYYGRHGFYHDCAKNVLTCVWLKRWLDKLRTEDIRVLRHVGFEIDSASKDATVKALAEAGIDIDRKMLRPVTYMSDSRAVGA